MNTKFLPVTDHRLLIQAKINQTQERYALVTVPRILSKTILAWAQTYVDRGGQFGEYMLDDLIKRVQDERFLEELACQEGVATRFLEECVQKTKAICLGEGA